MANRPPLPSDEPSYNTGNPFADRPRVVGIQEPSPYASTTSLTYDYPQHGEDIEDEKQPLTQFSGGFYPPT